MSTEMKPSEPLEPTPDGKKGRPTPTRKEREAAHRRPLVVDPKADKQAQREMRRALQDRQQRALLDGDEANMPPEHAGKERRFIRDFVDARTGVAEFLLPLSLFFVVASFYFNANSQWGSWVIIGFYLVVLVCIVEIAWSTSRLRRALAAKFGATRLPRGWRFYSSARAMNMRRLRVPRAKNKRGEYPQ